MAGGTCWTLPSCLTMKFTSNRESKLSALRFTDAPIVVSRGIPVEQQDVRPPQGARGQLDLVDATVLFRVPNHVVVGPSELHPHNESERLIFGILQERCENVRRMMEQKQLVV